MERVVTEGEVATANTYAQMFSTLPSCGRPTRLMTYDIHTLQNRFYLSGATLTSLHTTIPCLLPLLGEEEARINALGEVLVLSSIRPGYLLLSEWSPPKLVGVFTNPKGGGEFGVLGVDKG